jgi:hypothetical protein
MKEKQKKIKIDKLRRGKVTRNPELLIFLKLFKETGGYELLKGEIKKIFKRKKERRAEKVINTVMGLFLSGGKSISDIEIIKRDSGLLRILGEGVLYSANRTTELLKKMKEMGRRFNELLLEISTNLLKKLIILTIIKFLTIDIDVTWGNNEGKEAKRNYKGEKSMRMMTVSVKETRQMIYGYVDEGNKAAHSGLSETIGKVLEKFKEKGIMELVKRIIVRSDSAGWLREFIEIIQEGYGQEFIIKVRNDEAIKRYYRENERYYSEWEKFRVKDGDGKEREYESVVVPYVMGNNPKKMVSFNVYIYREKVGNKAVLGFGEYEVNWRWFAIATNGEYEPEELLMEYHDRGNSENLIKEMKWDIGLRRFSSGDLERNNLVFSFALISQNLIKYFQKIYLPEDWQSLMIASIRYRLKEAALVVIRGGQIILRFNPEYRYYNLWKRLLRIVT